METPQIPTEGLAPQEAARKPLQFEQPGRAAAHAEALDPHVATLGEEAIDQEIPMRAKSPSRHKEAAAARRRKAKQAASRRKDVNRRNGSRSKGPKTAAGKTISANNAFKHGLLATAPVLPDESMEAFLELSKSLHAALSPVGGLEVRLVQQIIKIFWRLEREGKMEAGVLNWQECRALAELAEEERKERVHRAAEQADMELNPHKPLPIDPRLLFDGAIANLEKRVYSLMLGCEPARSGAGFVWDSQRENAVLKLSRYRTSLERSLLKILHELQRLQAMRLGRSSVRASS